MLPSLPLLTGVGASLCLDVAANIPPHLSKVAHPRYILSYTTRLPSHVIPFEYILTGIMRMIYFLKRAKLLYQLQSCSPLYARETASDAGRAQRRSCLRGSVYGVSRRSERRVHSHRSLFERHLPVLILSDAGESDGRNRITVSC